ncbi:l-lysine permease [Clostridium sp. CAG:226]|jgi:arginine exporter protein ArgO|nr:l-lysine permease [Clostridium sp. CAG:226]
MAIYLRGLMMGLAYVAPIGTQNLFVINTAVTQQRKKAFATAAIVAFFDISLSLACFFGVGALMEALPWLRKGVLAIGSLIIIWDGYWADTLKIRPCGRCGYGHTADENGGDSVHGNMDKPAGAH